MVDFLKDYGDCIGPLDFPMKDKEARDLEKRLNSGEWSPLTLEKANSFECFINSERSDVSIITDGSVDRDGEIINPKSLNWDSFRKNPVVAFNHNYKLPPIGKSLWQKLFINNIWKAKTQYISKPDNYPNGSVWFPDSIFHMIKSGSLRGKSIGGVVKFREVTKEDIEKNPSWATAKRISEKVEIYEYSVVTVAANKNAIVEEISKGLLSIPEEIIKKDFPEVYEAIKDLEFDKEVVLPVIKTFKTSKEYIEEQKDIFNNKVKVLSNNIPKIISDTFNRQLGRVE